MSNLEQYNYEHFEADRRGLPDDHLMSSASLRNPVDLRVVVMLYNLISLIHTSFRLQSNPFFWSNNSYTKTTLLYQSKALGQKVTAVEMNSP